MGNMGPLAGIDFTAKYSYPEFTPGYVVDDRDGGTWEFIKATGNLTANLCYRRLPNGEVGSGTAALDSIDSNAASFLGGCHVCWPQQAFTSGEYGWVKLSGNIEASLAANVAAGNKLYTSTTAGVLDDVAASNFSIIGDAFAVDATTTAAVATIKVAGREPFLSPTAGV